MEQDLKTKIERAKELLTTSRHAAMATVNEDGSPHNTPFRFLYDPELKYIYWGSHPDSVHSMNVIRTGQVLIVLYDRTQKGGLYIKGVDAHSLYGEELLEALKVHNSFRIKENLEPLSESYYAENKPQKMWRATITNLWVNYSETGSDGHLLKDGRLEIKKEDLL